MKLIYSIDLKQGEKFINIFILGILMALKNNVITTDEAEGFIFKPYIADLLKKNISEELSEAILNGCELEDFEDIVPEILENRLNELLSTLLDEIKKQPDYGQLVNKEINII